MSLAVGPPQGRTGASRGWARPKGLLAPSLIDLGKIRKIQALYQAIPMLRYDVLLRHAWSFCLEKCKYDILVACSQ